MYKNQLKEYKYTNSIQKYNNVITKGVDTVLYFRIKLRKLRKEREMTQQQLADKLDVTKATVSAYETDAKYPSIEVLIKIAKTFEVSTDYLLGLSETNDFQNSQLTDEQNILIQEIERQFVYLNNRIKK